MTIKATNWVWRNSKTSGAERLVLLALADHADKHGVCWPSVPTLADRCQLSTRTVNRALVTLVEKGLLAIDAGGGRGKSNSYRVLPKDCPDVRVYEAPEETETLTSETLNPDIDANRTLYRNHQEPPLAESSSARVIPIKRERPPDPYWSAVVEAFDIDETQMTKSAKASTAIALNQLRGIKANPAEIRLRLERYRTLHPTWDATLHALVKYWHECGMARTAQEMPNLNQSFAEWRAEQDALASIPAPWAAQ